MHLVISVLWGSVGICKYPISAPKQPITWAKRLQTCRSLKLECKGTAIRSDRSSQYLMIRSAFDHVDEMIYHMIIASGGLYQMTIALSRWPLWFWQWWLYIENFIFVDLYSIYRIWKDLLLWWDFQTKTIEEYQRIWCVVHEACRILSLEQLQHASAAKVQTDDVPNMARKWILLI